MNQEAETEFVTNRQWDGLAARLQNKNLKANGTSLSATSIAAEANSYIIELQYDRGGMIVKVGWRDVMRQAANQ
jgi:hypothetical protein